MHLTTRGFNNKTHWKMRWFLVVFFLLSQVKIIRVYHSRDHQIGKKKIKEIVFTVDPLDHVA